MGHGPSGERRPRRRARPLEEVPKNGAGDRQTVRNLMEETTGMVNIDGNALRDVVKTHQLPIYLELE